MHGGCEFSWQGVEVWFVAIWTKIWSARPKFNSKSPLKSDGEKENNTFLLGIGSFSGAKFAG